MKKKIIVILTALVLCLSISMPVFAHEPGTATKDDNYYVYASDSSKFFSAEEITELDNLAREIYDKTGIEVLFAINEYADGDVIEYALGFYSNAAVGENGILLLITKDYWYVHFFGTAEEVFTDEDKDEIWDAYNETETFYAGVKAYYDYVSDKLDDYGISVGVTDQPQTTGYRLKDEADVVEFDEEETIESYFERISAQYGLDVTAVVVNSFEGRTIGEFADKFYNSNNYGKNDTKDGILLVVNTQTQEWGTFVYGSAKTAFTVAGQKYMYDTYAPIFNAQRYTEALNSYAGLCDRFLSQAQTGIPFDTGNLPYIPVERLLPRLVDEADILTDEQETLLNAKLDEISVRQGCDVAVVTVDSLGTKTATQFADDFYDYNGYGMNDTDDGILLLVSMGSHDWAITTYGYAITAFTDAGQKYLTEKFMPKLGDGKYYEAFEIYAITCDEFLTQAKTGDPFDTHNLPKPPFKFLMWACIALIVGFVVAKIITNTMKAQLKSVAFKAAASDYITPGSFALTNSFERFLRTDITKTKKPEPSSGGGSSGGSSTHVSSSGRSHGGSSGKF